MKKIRCRRCKGKCKKAFALYNEPFYETEHGHTQELAMSSTVTKVKCFKCKKCGHSFIIERKKKQYDQ